MAPLQILATLWTIRMACPHGLVWAQQ